MQKYIRITGLNSGSSQFLGTGIFGCTDIVGICRAGVNAATNSAFGTTSTANQTKVVYKDANSNDAVSVINHASSSTTAESVAMANYIKDLIVQAWEEPYTKPFVTISKFDAPLEITNISKSGLS